MNYLTTENLHEIIGRCLYTKEEVALEGGQVPKNAVIVEGVIQTFGMHPDRLKAETGNIARCLNELADEFMSDKGGGMSFLKMPFDKNGTQWGEQRNAEVLTVLGIGAGLASYLMPRNMWSILPGGVPYIVVDAKALTEALTQVYSDSLHDIAHEQYLEDERRRAEEDSEYAAFAAAMDDNDDWYEG